MKTLRWMRTLGAAGFAMAAGLGTGATWAYTVPDSTPPGIILVDVAKLLGESSPQFLWRRLGDAEGKPLYTYDAEQPGKASCYDACAKEFTPLVADARAKAFSDWSIVTRDDHVRQWAYQGKPLYRYSGTDPLGEPQSSNYGSGEQASWHDPASSVYSPKRGWRRAAYMPEKTLSMPTALQVDFLAAADGFGFVDTASHLTIYAVPVSHKMSSDWQPVRAAALAVPLGDFSIVTRKEDGTRQWTYRGETLYTYAGDYTPGDANGIFTSDKSIQAALIYHNFLPPGVSVGNYVGRGPLMTAKGLTLYYTARYHKVFGGREGPISYSLSYNDLKSQGTVACEADCAMTWRPLLAAANAQASGFWELIARADGSKQWVYKGSPVYTYFDDKKPGDIEGNNRSIILYGGARGEVTFADAGTGPKGPQHLGNLTMLDAVGRPREGGTYIAGNGYIGDEANARASGPRAPGVPVLGRSGPSDAGAGFYWHTVPLF